MAFKNSEKEECFRDGLNAYNEQVPDANKINFKFKQAWALTSDGVWQQETNWWRVVNSMKKFLLGQPSTYVQGRVPDTTIDDRWVVDLKFTGESFRDVPGAGNGCTQAQDYTQINQQLNPGNPGAGYLSLDPKTCNCPK